MTSTTRQRTLPAGPDVFRLPKEHGATVAFALGCILSLKLSGLTASSTAAILAMFAMMMSMHRPFQALLIGLGSVSGISILSGNLLLSLPLLAMSLGQFAMTGANVHINFGLKQTAGMAAVALLPLAIPLALHGLNHQNIVVFFGFATATLLSTALVQILVHSNAMKPTWSLVGSTVAAGVLAFISPITLVLLAVPFLAQLMWLTRHTKPSFKALGILETITLVACTFILAS